MVGGPPLAEALAFLSDILFDLEAGLAVGGGQSEDGASEPSRDFVALLMSPGIKFTPE